MTPQIDQAVAVLKNGGVIAYPTEFCYGLGCDPQNSLAIQRILQIKQRSDDQGLILIAANLGQVEQYANLSSVDMKDQVSASWPGPTTWVLPVVEPGSVLLTGTHNTIAMRVSAHPLCNKLCEAFGGAIVSTSANRHGAAALMSAKAVVQEMGDELDFVLDAELGGAARPSVIRDARNGAQLR